MIKAKELESGYQSSLSLDDELEIIHIADKIQAKWKKLSQNADPDHRTEIEHKIDSFNFSLFEIEEQLLILKGLAELPELSENKLFKKCIRKITTNVSKMLLYPEDFE